MKDKEGKEVCGPCSLRGVERLVPYFALWRGWEEGWQGLICPECHARQRQILKEQELRKTGQASQAKSNDTRHTKGGMLSNFRKWLDGDWDEPREQERSSRTNSNDTRHTSRSIIDLRKPDELEIERQAKSSLGGEDEQIARRLCSLIAQFDVQYSKDPEAAESTREQIREIGEDLCEDGGDTRMRRIGYRVAFLGKDKNITTGDLESHWSGICGWMS